MCSVCTLYVLLLCKCCPSFVSYLLWSCCMSKHCACTYMTVDTVSWGTTATLRYCRLWKAWYHHHHYSTTYNRARDSDSKNIFPKSCRYSESEIISVISNNVQRIIFNKYKILKIFSLQVLRLWIKTLEKENKNSRKGSKYHSNTPEHTKNHSIWILHYFQRCYQEHLIQ